MVVTDQKFMLAQEAAEEVVRIEPDGRVFLYGELVETDEQRLAAFSLIVDCSRGNYEPHGYKDIVEIEEPDQ